MHICNLEEIYRLELQISELPSHRMMDKSMVLNIDCLSLAGFAIYQLYNLGKVI